MSPHPARQRYEGLTNFDMLEHCEEEIKKIGPVLMIFYHCIYNIYMYILYRRTVHECMHMHWFRMRKLRVVVSTDES